MKAMGQAAFEPYVLRAAAFAGKELISIPEQVPEHSSGAGADLLAVATIGAMETLLHPVPIEQRAKMGLVFGTTLGCLESDREFDRSRRPAQGRYASPAAFSRTLPSTVTAEVALHFVIQGPSLVLSAGAQSAAMALRRAASWMNHFGLDLCIAGGIDWAGSRTGLPEGCRGAILLLGRVQDGAIGRIHFDPWIQPDLESLWDQSLDRLFAWTAEPATIDLGAGVHLVKTRETAPAADR